MKTLMILAVIGYFTLVSGAPRAKREAYALPDGVELIVGPVRTSFVCTEDGYFGDVDNNCQIFHVCQTAVHPDDRVEMQQWSFMCGNLTVFNQATFTCTHPEDAVVCESSRDFHYLNANLGAGPNVPFLTENDITRANALTPSKQGGFQRTAPVPRPQPPRGGGFRG